MGTFHSGYVIQSFLRQIREINITNLDLAAFEPNNSGW